jgi:hypothetical protein
MSAEYEIEPVPGLPEKLPAGESILWQGSPDWRSLSMRLFRLRLVVAYFAALLIWRMVETGGDLGQVGRALVITSTLAALSVGVLTVLGWLMARSTLYTITNRRVVIRAGVALPAMVNLPFRGIAAASLRAYEDGTADVPMRLRDDQRVGYFLVWPHARPGYFSRPEPMLRCVPDGNEVARILSRALAAAHGQVVPSTAETGSAAATAPLGAIAIA